jgi:hypothetical protein
MEGSMNASFARACAGALIATVALVVADRAGASEGRFEINQDCALAGCFPGDMAGYPIRITSSGNYMLVSDLTATLAGLGAIEIDASTVDWIDLDLNGYTIDGGGRCSGTPVTSCSGAVAFTGISFLQPAASDHVLLNLRDGVLRGFSSNGLALVGFVSGGAPLANGSVIENLAVTENAQDGVAVEFEGGMHVAFRDIRLTRNGGRGPGSVDTLDGSNIVAYGNGSNGLAAQHGSTIVGSRLVRNGNIGLVCVGPPVIPAGCTLAVGDTSFSGNGGSAYSIPVLRSMSNIVCIDPICP